MNGQWTDNQHNKLKLPRNAPVSSAEKNDSLALYEASARVLHGCDAFVYVIKSTKTAENLFIASSVVFVCCCWSIWLCILTWIVKSNIHNNSFFYSLKWYEENSMEAVKFFGQINEYFDTLYLQSASSNNEHNCIGRSYPCSLQ